jgi:hypothetical protein
MIKFESVGNNIYKLTCDLAPASGGGISGCGSHKQRMNTRRRSRRRRRRTYQKKRVSSKRYRRRSVRSRKN